MVDRLVIPVDHLVGSPGRERDFEGKRSVSLRLGESRVDGPMEVSGKVVGTLDGVQARFRASALASFVCNRCLTEWTETVEVEGSQHFRIEPDEDGYAIRDGAST